MSDKPGHILTIPDSLGRDVDRFHAGTGPAPPVEAFMSDASLEQVERQTAAASAPVHAEDLRPISGAEAARRTTFDGEHLPSMPAQRRVIPAPFARPGIRGGTHGKTWRHAQAGAVRAGDIVPGVGLVVSVAEKVRYSTRAEVTGPGGPPGEAAVPGMFTGKVIDVTGNPLYGRSEQVAVGLDAELTGAGGMVKTFRADEQVQVFRS